MFALNRSRQGVVRVALAALATLAAMALAGCDKPRVEAGQVLVRVNADDISVHQLSLAVAQLPNKSPIAAERDALLEKMIDRQLAVQQSLAQGLDRRPEVMLRLEEARRDILAAAYAEDITGRLDSPGDEAAARYFAAHPGLFAQRKIYRLREITLPLDTPVLAEVQTRLERKERFGELAAWLRQQPGRFRDQLTVRPAEQLPVEVIDRLSQLKAGDSIAFRAPTALVIYELQSTEASPMSWTIAAPMIKAHLVKQQGLEVFNQELKRLRASAKIKRQPNAG